MAYSKTNWENGKTALNASNMNNIEDGIYNNDAAILKLNERVETDKELQVNDITVTNTSAFSTSDKTKTNLSCYKRNGVVVISGKLLTATSIDMGKTVTVATLENEYRPPFGIHGFCFARDSAGTRWAFLYISSAGVIQIQYPSENISSNDYIYFTATYPVL